LITIRLNYKRNKKGAFYETPCIQCRQPLTDRPNDVADSDDAVRAWRPVVVYDRSIALQPQPAAVLH